MTTLSLKAEKAKIQKRVRALLAMGSDRSSLHEAEIALRRARTLMDQHQINLSDINNMDESGLGVGKYDLGSNKQDVWKSALVLKVAKLNDCIVTYTKPASTHSKQTTFYEFKGFQEDVELCEFMTVYLIDTCNRMYEQNKERLGLNGAFDKEDYLLGMSDKISERITDMIKARASNTGRLSDGNSLVLVKSDIVAKACGEQKTNATPLTREANYKAYRRGRIASNDVHLGSFINNDAQSEQEIFALQ